MGINNQREYVADLQIGSTDRGMVRLFFVVEQKEYTLDFSPEEALEIAEEIRIAADKASQVL